MTARILVVDDLQPNIKLLEAKLMAEYYDVITASSGKQALEIVKKESIDIILLDVMMPEMDGFEVCRKLKGDPETAYIPVVMVTALSEVEDRVQGLLAGADDFLTKPINDIALFARIRSLVRLKITNDELMARNQTSLELGMDMTAFNNEDSFYEANVVIVDDDVVQAKNIKNKLAEMGHKSKVTGDVKLAYEDLISGAYDLSIVSTQMVEADGLRLCSQLRSHTETRSLPILILVEEEDTEMLVKGLDIGVSDYIMCPIDGNELVARVNTQIKRNRYQQAIKKSYEKSVSMANTDGLTGLYNRTYFDIHYKNLLKKAEEKNRPLSLIIFDLDHFKKVNDTYGHLAGDAILKDIGKLVMSQVRMLDLVARYGGEEFIVILPGNGMDQAAKVAERIRSVIAAHKFRLPDSDEYIHCTASLGCATKVDGDTTNSLLKRADNALYKAKEAGRNNTQKG